MKRQTFKITHLYPKHMSLYGDRGNVVVLSQRAKSLGLELNIQDCAVGEKIDSSTKLIMLGGGQDHDQEKVISDLLQRENEIKELVAEGATFLGICGGYQLLGEYYESAAGSYLNGLKILNLHTKKANVNEKRIIGNVIAESKLFGKLFGFENHGGRTFLGDKASTLSQVLQGGGNNGLDGTEGVFANYGKGRILGTYFHGFLPKNPQVADYLLCLISGLPLSTDELGTIEGINQSNLLNLKY